MDMIDLDGIDSRTKEAMTSQTEEPTPASTWHALAGTTLIDELLEWPADLFALTNVILKRTEVYRFVLSPPAGVEWPPSRFSSWSDAVEDAAREWSAWIEDRKSPFPAVLAEEWSAFRQRVGLPLEHLAEGRDWRMCEALLTLHAIADEACAGLGMALDRSDGKGSVYRARGRELLARTGSLARIPSHSLRVLPKVRTPPNGTSFRSFSRYACVQCPGVEARWHKMPVRRSGTELKSRHVNLLLLPWPLRVRASDFRPVKASVQRLAKEPFGLFEFAPSERLDLELVSRMIVGARDEVDSVDAVLLPESAVDESDVNDLEALLDHHGVVALMTGVRQRSPQPGRFPGNWVHIGISPRLEKGASLPSSTGEQWFHIRQNKHHRWSLDKGQILQYHLGGALHPNIRWWEAMEVPRRAVHFVEHGDEIAIVSLVCEDLAQIDSVAEVIRSVGPTVVFTPLLDGPQLSSRWAARYASVLADDPGSAVLTLSSFGMVQRSRPHRRESSPVVALWKDPVRGVREIPLEAGAQGILLTTCSDRATRHSADGRCPVDNVTEHFDVAVHQVRASSASSGSSNSQSGTRAPCVLEVDELTILTGWAQAMAEVLEHAPDCVEALLAEAQAGAPWRAPLRIAEPSPQLSEAICFMGRTVRAVMSREGVPTLDALQVSCCEGRPEETRLEMLVRRVLRSALEQIRTRQAKETRAYDRPSERPKGRQSTAASIVELNGFISEKNDADSCEAMTLLL
ncbi:MAG TPA: hypothetical protein VFN26_03270 [Candidatus Acidoferrum sp.]|nr:hypothetical protein [Candidatus Acidoferrum sp.]